MSSYPNVVCFGRRHASSWLPIVTSAKPRRFNSMVCGFPLAPVRQDLAALSALTKRLSVERIVFLGDLVHSRAGVTEELVRDFATWLTAYPGDLQVVIGNHDTGLVKRWPAAWNRAKLSERMRIGNFLFQHQPGEGRSSDRTFQWAGDVHPVMRLVRGPERIRLPAFVISASQGLLPAFSHLAGRFEVSPSVHDRVFVVGKQDVYEV